MKKNIAILGSTGSIGKQSCEIIRINQEMYNIVLLCAYSNHTILLEQIITMKPKYVVMMEYNAYSILKDKIEKISKDIKQYTVILYGIDTLIQIIRDNKLDLIINGIIGIAGLKPTIEALKMGHKIAMANKESIICGMPILNKILEKQNKLEYIIPLDSEHFSLLRIFDSNASHFAITASGGPFFNNNGGKKPKEIKEFSIENAINHPNWKMGKKISVDSSNLMNKIFEVFEASCLFDIPTKNIQIIIHPQSIVHAISYYRDGSQKIFAFPPDMKIPIASALENLFELDNQVDVKHKNSIIRYREEKPKCNLTSANLEFFTPSIQEFPSIQFLESNQYITINAANETLVQAFLDGNIKFHDIVDIVSYITSIFSYNTNNIRDEGDVFEVDNHVRGLTKDYISKRIIVI